MEMEDSEEDKIKQMKARIKELERTMIEKQINIDYLDKMIDLAKEYYDIDIRKGPHTDESNNVED
ncbi:MAG TPA: hypothetical protein GX746_00435 [Bacteroidales bacterium]|nr:hypothetical protein [Bacteroidales bacterium]